MTDYTPHMMAMQQLAGGKVSKSLQIKDRVWRISEYAPSERTQSGTVVRVKDPAPVAVVQWDNGSVGECYFGELEPIQPSPPEQDK